MYTYKDFKKPVDEELKDGLTTIAVYFNTTHGMPLDMFNSLIQDKFNNKAEQMLFYMDFRNKNPKVFLDLHKNKTEL